MRPSETAEQVCRCGFTDFEWFGTLLAGPIETNVCELCSQMPPKGKSQARSQHSKQLMAQKTAAGRHPSHFREGVTKQPTPLPNVRDLQQQLSEKQQQHASELFQLEQQNAELQACADELEAEGQQLWELYMNTEATVRALCNQPWETMEVSLKELSAFRYFTGCSCKSNLTSSCCHSFYIGST